MEEFSALQIIPHAGINGNFEGLSTGEFDTEDNSLGLFRAEAFNPFSPTPSGLLWSQASGLDGAMTAGTFYVTTSGVMRRVEIAAITTHTFTASKDTWVSIDGTGTVDYDEETNGATPPTPPSGYTHIAIIVTNGTDITGITSLVARHPSEICRSTILTDGDTIKMPNLPTYQRLRLVMHGIDSGGTINAFLRFNGDSANNYSYRNSTNGAADTTTVSTSAGLISSATNSNPIICEADIFNYETDEKVVRWVGGGGGTAGAGNAPVRSEGSHKWVNTTDYISQIDVVNTGTGNYLAGSFAVVYAT